MNGTEFEAIWNTARFTRHCTNNDVRRGMALIRRGEQQQQKRIASLKPIDESVLEHTIGYEQLAVDLTAILAQREKNEYVKKQMDFALLEDFDHLYRYADLLDFERGIHAEKLVGQIHRDHARPPDRGRGARPARRRALLYQQLPQRPDHPPQRRHHHRRRAADDELLSQRR